MDGVAPHGATPSAYLDRLLRRRRRQRARQLVLWSRAGCHLCDELQEVVESVAAERAMPRLELTVRDLDLAGSDDPELLARYTSRVPVLVLDGVEVAHLWMEPAQLRVALLRPVDDAP